MNDFSFVSHTIYPYEDKIKEIFFYQNPKVPVDVVYRDGKEVDRGTFSFKFRKYLISQGYTIERIHVEAPQLNRTIHNLPLSCDNTECLYYDEKHNNKCNIKLKASVEVLKKRPHTVDSTKQILVQLRARDMQETITKVNCVIDRVFELTGIEGDPDTYSKTNLC